jgi:hypothetical protein
MDERLDRISASAFKTIFRFAVQSAAHQRSGLASRSVMRPPRYRTVMSTVRTVSNSFD